MLLPPLVQCCHHPSFLVAVLCLLPCQAVELSSGDSLSLSRLAELGAQVRAATDRSAVAHSHRIEEGYTRQCVARTDYTRMAVTLHSATGCEEHSVAHSHLS